MIPMLPFDFNQECDAYIVVWCEAISIIRQQVDNSDRNGGNSPALHYLNSPKAEKVQKTQQNEAHKQLLTHIVLFIFTFAFIKLAW